MTPQEAVEYLRGRVSVCRMGAPQVVVSADELAGLAKAFEDLLIDQDYCYELEQRLHNLKTAMSNDLVDLVRDFVTEHDR